MAYQSKDFVETADGLLFAVVSDRLEQDKLLCFLRYVKRNGQWCKLNTEQAYAHLNIHFPDYLYHSMQLDVALHAVSEAKIIQHFQPKVVLRQLLDGVGQDNVIRDFQGLCQLLRGYQLDLDQFGVTGSLLVGLQNPASDMDLVCYDRDVFQQARQVIQSMIAHNQCQNLSQADWLEAYQRRGCDFALDEYIWHEQRKFNKAIFNGRKFDLSLLANSASTAERQYQKAGYVHIRARVVDDSLAFDYPAQYSLQHPEVETVVCFTATYAGQAMTGETVEVAGQLEIDDQGMQRIVVGSNREALGEFIRVLH